MNDFSTPPIHFVRTGPRGRDPIILIHPVGLDLTCWSAQIEALIGEHDVIAYDLAGHGRSPSGSGDLTLKRFSGDIARLLDELDVVRAHVVGISVGGMIAQTFALSHSDRVASLTLIGTASEFADVARAGMQDRARRVREGGMPVVIEETMARWFTTATVRKRPDIVDRTTKMLLMDDPDVHAAMWDAISTLNITGRLSELKCPTLILVGDVDPSCPPRSAYQLHRNISCARIALLPETSHMAILECPSLVNSHILSFFAQIAAEGLSDA